MKIAVPSTAPGGLNAAISGHFGHADGFTLVDADEGRIINASVLENPPHAHGGCMAPVMLLKENGVDAIIVSGIGMRPLMGFRQAGIQVFSGAAGTVESAVNDLLEGRLRPAGEDVVCGKSKTGNC